jgi:hypothetical protein
MKEVKEVYSENSKTLKKGIKEDTRRCKPFPYSWIGRTNIVKMAILVKMVYRLNRIPIKISMSFTEIEKSIHNLA